VACNIGAEAHLGGKHKLSNGNLLSVQCDLSWLNGCPLMAMIMAMAMAMTIRGLLLLEKEGSSY
jgi:hypothetical protein